MMMKKSLAVGDSWTTTNMGSELIQEVIDLNGTIKTPNKTYTNCLVLQSVDNGTVSKSYYQKNIGTVAVTVTIEGIEKLFTYLIDE